MPPVKRSPNFDALEKIIALIIRYEGGPKVTNHPADRGGVTKYGITQGSWVAYCNRMRFPTSRRDVTKITADDAVAFYRNLFTNSCSLPFLPTPGLQHFVFDCVVHHGAKRAGSLLQRAVNDVLRAYHSKLPPLVVDGNVGEKTLAAVEMVVKSNRSMLMEMLRLNRVNLIKRIIEQRPDQRVFYKGWLNRINSAFSDAEGLDLERGII